MYLALPSDKYAPTLANKHSGNLVVPLLVTFEFPSPIAGVFGWQRGSPTGGVLVPEAPMYKDNDAILHEHDVWLPGKMRIVQSVPQARFMQ